MINAAAAPIATNYNGLERAYVWYLAGAESFGTYVVLGMERCGTRLVAGRFTSGDQPDDLFYKEACFIEPNHAGQAIDLSEEDQRMMKEAIKEWDRAGKGYSFRSNKK